MQRKYSARQKQEITKEIYLYYIRYFKEHGYSPSCREIQEELDIGLETVKRHVYQLIEDGLLATDHPGNPRAIRVEGYRFMKIKEKINSTTAKQSAPDDI